MDASNLNGDAVRRFTVENQPVRGHFVRIGEAWRVLREHRDHPAPVRELLGEAVSASVLLAATLKFRGTLTLQLQGGSGAVRLLVAQCTNDFRVRAVVRADEHRLGDSSASSKVGRTRGNGAESLAGAAGGCAALTSDVFRRLVGTGGRLVVTVEAAERGARYQGIVPLEGDSFAECLEEYFATSEQLPTRVRLAADETHAAGLLIQKLPGERGASEDTEVRAAWNDVKRGLGTVLRSDLLDAPVERVLTRNFGHQDLRLYTGSPVRFECRCTPERVTALLQSLGADEVREVLREQGAVTVTCDFCDRFYRFEPSDVEALFGPTDGPHSVH
ncbi:MAG TPA: Hsp33 family molecular chaperone HslO [Steroidobacteraceae bacterium]